MDRAVQRPVHWVGSSLKDLKGLPEDVQDVFGFSLYQVQQGGSPCNAVRMQGLGAAVLELKDNFDGDTYRCVYTVRFAEAVYVLHVFQKKSTSGIKTPVHEIDVIRKRLAAAEADYRTRYSVLSEGKK